jgi:hypothetical protein
MHEHIMVLLNKHDEHEVFWSNGIGGVEMGLDFWNIGLRINISFDSLIHHKLG